MVRALVLAAVASLTLTQGSMSAQTLSVLHIKVVLADADRKTTPVPGHALLISDNPATSAPRLIRTAVDGTADVRLRPGNYTVESDHPVAFRGKAYQWTQTVDVRTGRDSVLELTIDNAEVATAAPATDGSEPPLEADPAFLLPRWQDSVVGLWTPTAHGSAFVIDSRGLVVTNQKAIGTAMSAELQLTPEIKVAGRVLAADTTRDVAILWVDPQAVASLKPVPLACKQPAPSVAERQQIYAIGVPLHQLKDMTSGTLSNLVLPSGSAGGPVFTADGTTIGITSVTDADVRRASAKVVRVADACEVLATAEQKMTGAMPPGGAHLPIEPAWTLPEQAFKDAAMKRVGSLNPYQVTSESFEVSFITPVMIFGSRYQQEQLSRRRNQGRATFDSLPVSRNFDFGSWSDYVEDVPPVLLVRVTPRMVEGAWQKVARGAAYTQGAALPAFKHAKPGFVRMNAFCGDREVTPIHPFRLEMQISEKDRLSEGLYAFDPGAFGPHCESVRFVLFGEKEPEKAETRVVEANVVQRIWNDFAPYR